MLQPYLVINVTGLVESTKPGSVWEKFDLHLTSTCLLELLAAEYLCKTNISIFISHLCLLVLTCSLKKSWKKKETRIKKGIVEVLQQATISDKNCETRTPSPLIQCWLQVCLLICGVGCLAMLLQACHNIESGGRGDSG